MNFNLFERYSLNFTLLNYIYSHNLFLKLASMDKVTEQQSFSKYDIRVIIKFFALSEKRPPEIHQILCDTLGTSAPSIQTVRKWVASFEGGRLDVEDEQRSGRPQRPPLVTMWSK